MCICLNVLEISVYNKNDTILSYLKTIIWFVCLFTYFLVCLFVCFSHSLANFFPTHNSCPTNFMANGNEPQNFNLRTKTPQFKTQWEAWKSIQKENHQNWTKNYPKLIELAFAFDSMRNFAFVYTLVFIAKHFKSLLEKKLNVSNLFESDWFARDWKTIAIDNVLNENYPNHWGVKQKTNENVRIKENLYWQKCTITSAHSEKVSCVVFVHSLLISRTRN